MLLSRSRPGDGSVSEPQREPRDHHNAGRRLETPGNTRRKSRLPRHEEWNSQESLGGSEEEVRLGHRRACRVTAGKSAYLEGKIAPKKNLEREIVQNQPLIRNRGRRFEIARSSR